MGTGWLTCYLEVLLPHSLCRSTTANAPANRQMPIASVVMGYIRKKERYMKNRIYRLLLVVCLTLIFLTGCTNHSDKTAIHRPHNLGKNIFITGQTISGKYSIIKENDCTEELIIVKKNNRFGLINEKKQIVLPIEYDTVMKPRCIDNYFYLGKDKLCGVVTEKGNLNIPIIYEFIARESKKYNEGEDDCFIVQKNKKFGSVDFYNNTIIPTEYDGITNWVEYGPKSHYVMKGNLYGLVDYNTGKIIIPTIYDGLTVYSNYWVKVKKDNVYGILSIHNKTIIPIKYDKVYMDLNFMELEKNHKDRIYTRKNEKWYEFSTQGKLLKSNINTGRLDKWDVEEDFFTSEPDSNEFSYELRDLMITQMK